MLLLLIMFDLRGKYVLLQFFFDLYHCLWHYYKLSIIENNCNNFILTVGQLFNYANRRDKGVILCFEQKLFSFNLKKKSSDSKTSTIEVVDHFSSSFTIASTSSVLYIHKNCSAVHALLILIIFIGIVLHNFMQYI